VPRAGRIPGQIASGMAIILAIAMMLAPAAQAADAALIEAAGKEGQVVWYTTLIVNQAIRPLQDAFEKKYPGVKLQYSRADDAPTALKILSEARAGRVQADVFDSLYSMIAVQRAGLIAPYRPPNIDQFPADLKDKDGYWTALVVFVFGTGVNIDMVPLAPRRRRRSRTCSTRNGRAGSPGTRARSRARPVLSDISSPAWVRIAACNTCAPSRASRSST
jgi:Bacterial extracellular solute-binding protein